MDLITQRLTVADFLSEMGSRYPSYAELIKARVGDVDVETVPFIRKGYSMSSADITVYEGDKTEGPSVVSKITTLSLDRDQEVILPEGALLEDFFKNNIVLFGHNYYSMDAVMGRAVWVRLDRKQKPTALLAKTVYASKEANPKAFQSWKLQQEGILLAKSIGFWPLESVRPGDDNWEKVLNNWRKRRDAMLESSGIIPEKNGKDPIRIYTKWSLWEYSDVPVPSNPDALTIAVSKGILTAEEAKVYEGAGRILTGKDLADHLGKMVAENPDLRVPVTDVGASTSASLSLSFDEDDGEPFDPQKPYPNEHACRLHDPDEYDSFRRKNCERKHDGKCIDVIYGIKGDTTEVQALRYPKDEWTAASAKAHCTDQDGSFEPATESVVPDGEMPLGRSDTAWKSSYAASTPTGKVSGTWEAEEQPERDPLEAMRLEGIANAKDGFVPVSVDLWNALFNSLKNAIGKANQSDADSGLNCDDLIEVTPEEFQAKVKARLEEMEHNERVQNLSDNVAGLKTELAKTRVQLGGIA